jgi:hypothetical protein
MARYHELVEELRNAGFIGDPLGKCRRTEETLKGQKSRIDLFLKRSETWNSYQNRKSLKSEFSRSKAKERFLIWLAGPPSPSTGDPEFVPFDRIDFDQKDNWQRGVAPLHPTWGASDPLKVSVDFEAKVVCWDKGSTKLYGDLCDFEFCLFHLKDGVYSRDGGPKPVPVSNLITDLQEAEARFMDLDSTSRKQLIDARIGQGQFRQGLIRIWGCCAVTKLKVPEVLRASHIKPWSVSTNEECLDPYNGFLMTPNLDHLFDSGLISFSDQGDILLGEQLDHQTASILGIHSEMKLCHVYPENIPYLKYHRELHGFQ